jgi:hypothetical protein
VQGKENLRPCETVFGYGLVLLHDEISLPDPLDKRWKSDGRNLLTVNKTLIRG